MDHQNNTPQEILDKLRSLKKVIISLHSSPDGDSLGSSAALKYLLEQHFNIKVDLISGDQLSAYLTALPFSNEVDQTKDITDINFSEYDALINIDIATLGLISTKERRKFQKPDIFIINIDHHNNNDYYGDINYVTTTSSSASEVLFDLLKLWQVKIDKTLATKLLVGMYSDTNGLKFGYNKSSIILKKIAELIDTGVDPETEIINPLFFNTEFITKKFQGLVLSKLTLNPELHVAYSVISQDDWQSIGIKEEELTDVANSIQDISECEFIFTLTERHDHIRGSLRSRKNIDVSLFAKELNGGGHKPAAGFALKKMPLEEAEQIVLETIKKVGIHKYD